MSQNLHWYEEWRLYSCLVSVPKRRWNMLCNGIHVIRVRKRCRGTVPMSGQFLMSTESQHCTRSETEILNDASCCWQPLGTGFSWIQNPSPEGKAGRIPQPAPSDPFACRMDVNFEGCHGLMALAPINSMPVQVHWSVWHRWAWAPWSKPFHPLSTLGETNNKVGYTVGMFLYI